MYMYMYDMYCVYMDYDIHSFILLDIYTYMYMYMYVHTDTWVI